jgi:hypothetical protein
MAERSYYQITASSHSGGDGLNKSASCILCREIVCNHSGGGEFICQDCYEIIRSPNLKMIRQKSLQYSDNAIDGMKQMIKTLNEYENEHAR